MVTGEDSQFPLCNYLPYEGKIRSITARTKSGTIDFSLIITPVSGSPVTVTGTSGTANTSATREFPTANEDFSETDNLDIKFNNNSSAEGVSVTVEIKRCINKHP
jgi:hypothetical protein